MTTCAKQERINEGVEIGLVMKIPHNMPDGCAPHSVKSVQRVPDEFDALDKVLQRSRLIEKTGLAIHDQLRNAGDVGREYRYSARHSFHQGDWNALTPAGEYHQIGLAIKGSEFRMGYVAEQLNLILKSEFVNLTHQAFFLGAVARDQTLHAARAQGCTSAEQ